MRIELTLSAWKAEVLPLNYIRKVERKTRFELATLALARRCSTPEPLPHIARSFPFMLRCCSLAVTHILSIVRFLLAHAPRILRKIASQIFYGRGGWIRTFESSANGFTVRPLWPLGNPSKVLVLMEGFEPPTC